MDAPGGAGAGRGWSGAGQSRGQLISASPKIDSRVREGRTLIHGWFNPSRP